MLLWRYYDEMIYWQMMIWCLIKTRDNPWLISHMQSAKSDNGYFSMKGNTHTMCIACNLLRSFSLKGLCSSIIIYRVSLKKRYFLDFLSYFSSRGRILLFLMCFRIRISSPFHIAIQKISIQYLNCPKNACADIILSLLYEVKIEQG